MKTKIMWILFALAVFVDVACLLPAGESFVADYVKGGFERWGYPQWGWMYQSRAFYAVFNLVYLLLAVLLLAGAVFFAYKKRPCAAILFLLPELLSVLYFVYMPYANFQKQVEIFKAEKGESNTRIPEGSWWVFPDEMQRYDDASAWEKLKGYMGRGEWPGGYPIWGEYRIWLLPDLATDTLGRRGLVLHGGTMNVSPWGANLGNDMLDLAIAVRKRNTPFELKFWDVGKQGNPEQNEVHDQQ